jgi:hypothetical protein
MMMEGGDMFLLFLISCTDDVVDEPISPVGMLKIEEVYYAGSIPTAGIDRYYSDQFVQLRNISEHTLDIGGLGIGDIHGLAGEINSGYGPNSYASDSENLYFENLWQIPMESPYRYIPPGGCIKIAQDAADHGPYSQLSHFDAHFETFVESGEDHDDPIVENLTSIFYSAGYDWLVTVFGPTIVIVDQHAVEDGGIQTVDGYDLWVTPSSSTIDTMESVMDENSADYKRLHADIDSGFQYVSGTYTGESVRRKKDGEEWIDTDNSTDDFYVTSPIDDCGTE